jgi:ubiquinol-cytochrome c reductase cytochrome c1 subunit
MLIISLLLIKIRVILGVALIYPFKYLRTRAYFRNLLSVRYEMYAVRDGVYYSHFKSGTII